MTCNSSTYLRPILLSKWPLLNFISLCVLNRELHEQGRGVSDAGWVFGHIRYRYGEAENRCGGTQDVLFIVHFVRRLGRVVENAIVKSEERYMNKIKIAIVEDF